MWNTCNFISCNLLLFALNLFHLIARILFDCCTCVLLNTIIYFIFVISILLMIFLTPIFLLNNYTGTINNNVCNVFKICSALFRIRCMFFVFPMTNINMFLHVPVYGIYLFYLRFVHIHNLFHINAGGLM